MNNEHFGYAVPERSRRAVQAMNNEQLRVFSQLKTIALLNSSKFKIQNSKTGYD